LRILVAETDLPLLAEISQALERAGYEVTACSDGMSAWDSLVGTAPPDLVVTRGHLGPGTPPGTALGLHAYSCDPRIPVVYIPAGAAEPAEHADPEHGAVLVKPFAVTDLVATVNRLVGRRLPSL
jgi:two-component system, cell cycle response regulator CpdR